MNASELEEIRSLLSDAISQRRLIEFRYENEQHTVEPYACGIGRADTMDLRGLPISVDPAETSALRTFTIGNMRQTRITDGSFDARLRPYDTNDKALKEMFFSINTPVAAKPALSGIVREKPAK